MQQTKKRLFALALALWALSSCSQDASDVQGLATVGETVTFSLSAEVSVEDEQSRAIDYKLGNNAQGQLVPLPQFRDNQEVEVHTILKSSRGIVAAKTLKWKYNAATKKLVLSQDSHDIEVSGFNNDNSTKWYISGLIGGVLSGTKVEFLGSRVVKGVDGNAGDALGSMDVPYAFGWTELTINTSSPKDGNGSHKYAEVLASESVKFQPLGSMLAVKLGSNQSSGAYTFTPKGFTLASNAWGDQGSFELNTAIPSINPHTALPTWTEGSCAGSMYYTFASGEEPGAIAHNQVTAKTYYVWVMPHKTLPTTADVRVMLKGTSSRPETATYKDYTNTWFTDYSTEGKATQGKVTQGRVHLLTAKATHRVALPIEYVTEYNLAGGEGLTYTVVAGSNDGFLNSPTLRGIQPVGVTGSLRFATSHRNDQSGYYNSYRVRGLYDAIYNPHTRSLQTEIDRTFGPGVYGIPTFDQLEGSLGKIISWGNESATYNSLDRVRIGSGLDSFRQAYLFSHSQAFYSSVTGDATIYAIRLKGDTLECSNSRLRNPIPGYPLALDNSLKCAYRYRRIGNSTSWEQEHWVNTNLTNQIIIDVVYLGEELVPTDLSTISDDSWWSMKQSQSQVISRTFPASGQIYSDNAVSGILRARGSLISYNVFDTGVGYPIYNVVLPDYLWDEGFPVRLFVRRI